MNQTRTQTLTNFEVRHRMSSCCRAQASNLLTLRSDVFTAALWWKYLHLLPAVP